MLNPFLEHKIDSIVLVVDNPSSQVLGEGGDESLFYRHSKTIEIDILGFRRHLIFSCDICGLPGIGSMLSFQLGPWR